MDLRDLLILTREVAAIYRELRDSLIGPLPDVSGELAEILYRMKPARGEDVEKLAQELAAAGHGDIVKELLEKPPKILVGVLYSYGPCGEAAYRVYEELAKSVPKGRVSVEDFATDALTVADAIKGAGADQVVILTIKRRGREPGVYTRSIRLKRPSELEAVEEIRPSLEGLLDVDALIRGLNVFLGEGEIEVHECEPASSSCGECVKLLLGSVRNILGNRDGV